MALTLLQRRVCRALADRRIADGESYVAGGLALNQTLGGARLSRDIDLFHDTDEALTQSVDADLRALRAAGVSVTLVRQLIGFVEATSSEDGEELEIQWLRDSAFRFFPLVTDPDLGLVLHPLDLATNKTLALVGRVEARDWVDILTCHARLTSLGLLAWAACGKDPGLGPRFILEEAARTARYSAAEIAALAFEGAPPDHASLGRAWRDALVDGRAIVDALPPTEIGKAVLDAQARPFRGDREALERALAAGDIVFHPGSIRGAFPTIRAKATV